MSEIPDFYRNQSNIIDNREIIGEMHSKYDRFLKNYLEKKFDEGVDQGLLALVKANGDNINFRIFLDYLLSNQGNNLEADDVYQIAALKNEVINLREEIEDMGPRDFQIIEGNIGNYRFMGADTFQYLGRNFYAVKIDFSKIKDSKVNSFINIRRTYNKGDTFFIEYDGNNVIKYYSGRNFEDRKLIGHEVISHKEETVIRRNTVYRRGAEQDVYLKYLGMNLRIKFFEKRER